MPALRLATRLLLSCLLFAPLSVSAAVVDGLYRVDLPQGEEQSREDALRQATEVMLTRIAGSDAPLGRGALAEALKDPRRFMRRIGGAEGGRVDIEFEPAALRELMASAGLPMLGRNRPGVLVWAVEAQVLGDEILGQGGPLAEALRNAAAYRGVALSFPLGDLEDRSLVDESDIRSRDRSTLVDASERYAAEGTLALAVNATEQEVQIQWDFWLNDEAYSGRISEADRAQAADALMLAVSDAVFQQYSVPVVPSAELTNWELVVEDVNAVADYAALQRLLLQLGAQSVPELLSVEADRVRVRVGYPGDEAQLERMLNLDQRLVRIPAPLPEPVLVAPAVEEPALSDTPDGVEPPLDEPSPVEPAAPVTLPEPDPYTLYYRWR